MTLEQIVQAPGPIHWLPFSYNIPFQQPLSILFPATSGKNDRRCIFNGVVAGAPKLVHFVYLHSFVKRRLIPRPRHRQ